ncbi:unnamed protein product [Haemonchus placei]|uniref:DUF1963 domain-containing protein n=1 Tax=Haemonchus placei TaxID=6290 RepID=A0A0N4VU93_HAEPC|nr:unnamed protein product [Haemonchus placei]
MPTGIARYWDSLEGNDYLDQCQPHTGHFPRLDDCQKQWLSELSSTTEPECQSILYAKSLLDDGTDSATPVIQELQQLPEPQPKIPVGFRLGITDILVLVRSESSGAIEPPRAYFPRFLSGNLVDIFSLKIIREIPYIDSLA